MDPLSALSVACNVLQLVELGGKLVSTAFEAHNSATGQSVDNAFIDERTQELQACMGEMKSSLLSRSSQLDQTIQRLAGRGEEITKELIALLQYVRARSPGKMWSSLAAAFRQMKKDSQIKTLTARLDKLQKDLSLYLINAVRQVSHANASDSILTRSARNEQSSLSRNLGSLRSDWRRLDIGRGDQIQSMRQDLLHAITSMDGQLTSWHNATTLQFDLVQQSIQGIRDTITSTLR